MCFSMEPSLSLFNPNKQPLRKGRVSSWLDENNRQQWTWHYSSAMDLIKKLLWVAMYVSKIDFLCVHVFRRGNLRQATLPIRICVYEYHACRDCPGPNRRVGVCDMLLTATLLQRRKNWLYRSMHIQYIYQVMGALLHVIMVMRPWMRHFEDSTQRSVLWWLEGWIRIGFVSLAKR